MSGNVVMNTSASLPIAARPTAGVPLLMLIEPRSAKNAPTRCGSWLHHACAYRTANLFSSSLVTLFLELAQIVGGVCQRFGASGNDRVDDAGEFFRVPMSSCVPPLLNTRITDQIRHCSFNLAP